MTRLILTILIALSITRLNASSLDLVDPLTLPTSTEISDVAQCANLDGIWSGHCFENGGSTPKQADIDIKQFNCSILRINGTWYPIGGSFDINMRAPKGSTSPVAAHVLHGMYLPSWEKDQTTLRVMSTSNGHSLDAAIPEKSFASSNSIMYLSNPKTLIRTVEVKGTLYLGDKILPFSHSTECKYSKD